MDNQQAQVDPPTNPENYAAALELAYPLAIEAYKEAERRMDVIEKRLQDVLAFAVTITLGMIGLLAGKIELRTPFFYVAMLLCLLGLSIGLYARLSGGLALISLTKIYDHYLIFTASKFKLAAVENAGEDSAINAQTIRNKANLTAFAAFIFLAEGACLVATVVNQPISAPHATAVQRPSSVVVVPQAKKAKTKALTVRPVH